MKCPSLEQLELLACGATEAPDADAWRGHLEACERCRAAFLMARRAHIQRLRAYEALDHHHDRYREQLLAQLDQVGTAPLGRPSAARRLGDLLMSVRTNRISRVAAVLLPIAACVAIVAFLLPSDTRTSAFAAAIKHLRDASTIKARFQAFMNNSDAPIQSGSLLISDQHGMRFESGGRDGEQTFTMTMIKPAEGPMLMLQPSMKLAVRMHTPPGFTGVTGDWNQTSPSAFIDGMLRWTGEADRSLGRSQLDGREVEGYEVNGDKVGLTFPGDGQIAGDDWSGVRVWVDVQKRLPVRMEFVIRQTQFPIGSTVIRAVYDEIEFDLPLAASLFATTIPADLHTVDLQVPERTEETLINSLRLYAEVAGNYPQVLEPARVSGELSIGLATRGEFDFDDPASLGRMMERVMHVAIGCSFAQDLALRGCHFEYHGAVVTPEDAQEVLARWTLPEGGTRVIYGDLRVETVASEPVPALPGE